MTRFGSDSAEFWMGSPWVGLEQLVAELAEMQI